MIATTRILPLALACLSLAAAPGCDRGEGSPAAQPPPKTDVRRFWEIHDRARDLFVAEDFARAAATYREALSLSPRHTASLYNLAFSELRLGRHEEALAALRRLEEADPHETKPKLLAGMILGDPRPEGPFDLAAAREMLARAIEMNREESGPFLLQGRTTVLAGDAALAETELALASRANPSSAEALNLLGSLALRRGDAEAAAGLFRRALKAARGAPPPAGLPGEGDTARAGAGYHRTQLLLARWLLALAGREAPGKIPAGDPKDDAPPPAALERVEEAPFDPVELAGSSPRSGRALVAADFDLDGAAELAVGSLAGPIEIYSQRDGRLARAAAVEARGASFLAAGDLDGDSRPDLYALVGGDLGSGVPRVLLSREGLRFEDAPAPGPSRRTLAAVIVAASGGAEVIEAGLARTAGSVRLVRPRGGELGPVEGAPADGCGTSAAALRAPGGEAPDVAIAFARRAPLLFRRAGDGSWRAAADVKGLEALEGFEAIAALDADGDGWDDLAGARGATAIESLSWLVEGKAEGPAVRVLRRAGRDAFEPAALDVPPFAARAAGLLAWDLDGDRAQDLLVPAGGPEPWRAEPPWALLRSGSSFALRRVALPRGTFSAVAAAVLEGAGGSRVVLAGGGVLPSDAGRLFLLEPARPR